MPTIAEGNKYMLDYDRSWTDDLPVCKLSGKFEISVTLHFSCLLLSVYTL